MASDDVAWRHAVPEDHAGIAAVVDDWWGGRRMADMLPRLFFDHFRDTSFVASAPDGTAVAFVVSFVSPHDPATGYVHFIGVHPGWRGRGLGQAAYEHAFAALSERGCHRVVAVTSPANVGSQAFHRALGFDVSETVADYDGPGEDRVVLTRGLDAPPSAPS